MSEPIPLSRQTAEKLYIGLKLGFHYPYLPPFEQQKFCRFYLIKVPGSERAWLYTERLQVASALGDPQRLSFQKGPFLLGVRYESLRADTASGRIDSDDFIAIAIAREFAIKSEMALHVLTYRETFGLKEGINIKPRDTDAVCEHLLLMNDALWVNANTFFDSTYLNNGLGAPYLIGHNITFRILFRPAVREFTRNKPEALLNIRERYPLVASIPPHLASYPAWEITIPGQERPAYLFREVQLRPGSSKHPMSNEKRPLVKFGDMCLFGVELPTNDPVLGTPDAAWYFMLSAKDICERQLMPRRPLFMPSLTVFAHRQTRSTQLRRVLGRAKATPSESAFVQKIQYFLDCPASQVSVVHKNWPARPYETMSNFIVEIDLASSHSTAA